MSLGVWCKALPEWEHFVSNPLCDLSLLYNISYYWWRPYACMVSCICAHGRDHLRVWSPTINAYIPQNRGKCIINQCNILLATKSSWLTAQMNMSLRTPWGQPGLSLFTSWYTMSYSPQGQPDNLFAETVFYSLLALHNVIQYMRAHAKETFISHFSIPPCYPCATAFGFSGVPWWQYGLLPRSSSL